MPENTSETTSKPTQLDASGNHLVGCGDGGSTMRAADSPEYNRDKSADLEDFQRFCKARLTEIAAQPINWSVLRRAIERGLADDRPSYRKAAMKSAIRFGELQVEYARMLGLSLTTENKSIGNMANGVTTDKALDDLDQDNPNAT